MAATWLLQALYTSILSSGGLQGGQAGTSDVYLLANTTYGTVRGKVDLTPQVPIVKFLGIPFAKPPIGQLRFKASEAPDPWNGVKNTLAFGSSCMQGNNQLATSEDCLFLNVFGPTVNKSPGALPVMLFIHGGGYIEGSSSQIDGTTLATKGVIVVTTNYRLNSFGFLSTEDDEIPGNFGMLDQIAALKWIQKNIAAFGGDPNTVTIFGESAGSSSVSLLTISPLAKGLFQRAIMQSGVSISPFGIQHPGNRVSALTNARLIAAGVECPDLVDTKKMAACLRSVDAKMLLNVTAAVNTALDVGLIMCPRVETTYGFLPDLPLELIKKGQFNHVDTIRGFTTQENGLFLAYGNFFKRPMSQKVGNDVMRYWLKQLTDLDQEEMINIIKAKYITDESNMETLLQEAMKSQDDISFIGPTMIEINQVSARSQEKNHFLYEFNHRPSFSYYPKWISATHADDIAFTFGVNLLTQFGVTPSADDIAVSEQIMEMWSNFAKTGVPKSTTWSRYSDVSPNYLLIKASSERRVWQRTEAADFYFQVLERLDGTPSQLSTIVG